ncbi:MAG: cytochrome c-type biogenesis protein CcmH [Rhizobiaceae bacterium]|nr:MAG: cytochrome c-type biogenesis protein CcmH [Rhizobiaceae bacterium]
MKLLRLAFALLILLAAAAPAFAVRPDEMLKDPKLEARAREISKEVRCLVCQNESIDDSNADLAHDLRVLVRQRILAGDSNPQVLDYLVSRYGEFVLLKPRFDLRNALLWGTPFILLVAGGVFVFGSWRSRRRRQQVPPLSEEEATRLEAILAENGGEPR